MTTIPAPSHHSSADRAGRSTVPMRVAPPYAAQVRVPVPSRAKRHAAHLRAALDLSDQIGLALRAERRQRRVSQRDFARLRGWSPAHQGRLECLAAELPSGRVFAAFEDTDYALGIASTQIHPHLVHLCTAADTADWVSGVQQESGISMRWLATKCGLSQTMMARLVDPGRSATVRLDRVESVIELLGSNLVVGFWTSRGLREVDPDFWPVEALVPRVRDGTRRLAAHGWTRGHMPTWWWRSREDITRGPVPSWTAQGPTEPRLHHEPGGNALAPRPPLPDQDEPGE